MTRLIDADKLEAYGTTVPKECNAEDYLSGARDVLEHIDLMPTVDAIPIEWIKDYINHLKKTVSEIDYFFAGKRLLENEIDILEDLLTRWRMEESE